MRRSVKMSSPRWMRFWRSLLGEHEFYKTKEFADTTAIEDLQEGCDAMRVYRNTDGTWSLMPNWFKSDKESVPVHKRSMATTYENFEAIPVHIQEKLGVLMLQDPGTDWLTGIGKRVDDGVFWLEDG
jgi:hypothetical protein